MQYVNGKFMLDGDMIAIEGIHDPTELWNGWSCPLFTIETVAMFLTAQRVVGDIKSYDMTDTSVTVHYNDTDFDTYNFVTVEGVKMCMLGGYAWVWTVVED